MRRPLRRSALIAGLLGASSLASATPSPAATRYVTPSAVATSAPCSAVAPCTFASAVALAQDGDEVLVGSGDYSLSAPVVRTTGDISVRGADGGTRPRLVATGGAYLEIRSTGVLANLAFSGACGKFELTSPGCATLRGTGTVERLDVETSGPLTAGIVIDSGLVRDSQVRVTGASSGFGQDSAIGVSVQGAGRVRNVTSIATGPGSIGIAVISQGVPVTGEVVNSVARGAQIADLYASGLTAKATLQVSHSNFTTSAVGPVNPAKGAIAAIPPNQSASPLFADGAIGDLRPLAGSPLIDAGEASAANGPLDVAGRPRTLGAAPDIGAHEFGDIPGTQPAPPAPASPVPPAAPPSADGAAALRTAVGDDLPRTLRAPDAGVIRISLDGLPAGTRATVTIDVPSPRSGSAATRRTVIARGAATADARGSAKVGARLTKSGRSLVRKLRRKRSARLTVRLAAPNGTRVTITRPVDIPRPKR